MNKTEERFKKHFAEIYMETDTITEMAEIIWDWHEAELEKERERIEKWLDKYHNSSDCNGCHFLDCSDYEKFRKYLNQLRKEGKEKK